MFGEMQCSAISSDTWPVASRWTSSTSIVPAQLTQRRVRLLRVDADHVRAYCYERRAVRMFNLANIHAVVSLLDHRHYKRVEHLWSELASQFGLHGIYRTPYPHFS